MNRPWTCIVGVVLGLAALPGVAAAQAPADPDTTGPSITITAPTDGATYTQGQPVQVAYACDDPAGVADCVGTVPNAGMLDTSVVGPGSFTVTAHDSVGNASAVTQSFSVVAADVGGTTPATLTLTLGPSAAFAPFIPGIEHTYTAAGVARVVSTADDALLTVADPSDTATGHLVNGAYALPQPLQANATSATGAGGSAAAIGGLASPTTLLTWVGPAVEDVALTFTQAIGATDALRSGAYGKTLTFTLSTTTP